MVGDRFLLHSVKWPSNDSFSSILQKYVGRLHLKNFMVCLLELYDIFMASKELLHKKYLRSAEFIYKTNMHVTGYTVFVKFMSSTMPKNFFYQMVKRNNCL